MQLAVINLAEPSAFFHEERLALANSPLDEGAGEGYHRSTNLSVLRAPGAKTPFTLANVREAKNLDLNRDFCGNTGNAVRRYLIMNGLT